ncbi:microsomal signal peptidase 12kDa subunit [Patellaria atrata CBS 101060]|uniref:Signal peptidase complex subunit 1 n=1 Tax=Patellaria atrata CBS 101060 TaxID=1346257 RepID=A0A9P4VU71_9PEZI|nr:microsomal signal peptidase 12kDa subunit [Patellaria atrata CBS 101060]
MADALLEQIRDMLEGQIDFEGQRLAEILATSLLIAFGTLAAAVGFLYGDIYLTLYVFVAGTIFTALAVIPPWPFYNKNPAQWQNPQRGISGVTIEM